MTTTLATPDRLSAARRVLEQTGQAHVLEFYDTLSPAEQASLLGQIESVDWVELTRLVETHVKNKPKFELPHNVQPAPWYPNVPSGEQVAKYKLARAKGEELVRLGKVAAFTVAGGQGTRLGWDAPKGTFPATPIRKQSLFGCFAEYLLKAQAKWGNTIPWYIMTSPINDGPTRAFFREHSYFGLDPRNVMFFSQAMMPAIDMQTGKVLMESKSTIALSPNGHGGSLKALYVSGAVADMKKRGVEHISYIQVDNPIVRVVDPLFLGLHALDGCQMSSKMLPKAYPKEKLGNFCLVDGKMTVIEYSDLPDELAEQRVANGDLRFRAGSIAIHAIRVDFVESLNNKPGGFSLPFHRADKRVPYLDPRTQTVVKPEKVNAVKLETFVFDALPMCEQSIIYETDRADEFAPIKNADAKPGEAPVVDCPATSHATQTARIVRWLEVRGVKIAKTSDGKPACAVELNQATAIYPEDLDSVKIPAQIEAGQQVVL